MLDEQAAARLSVRTMTFQINSALSRLDQPRSVVAQEALDRFIDELERVIALVGWFNAGCPAKDNIGPITNFYMVLTEALEPREDDADAFLDLLSHLHETGEQLRENRIPDNKAVKELQRVLRLMGERN